MPIFDANLDDVYWDDDDGLRRLAQRVFDLAWGKDGDADGDFGDIVSAVMDAAASRLFDELHGREHLRERLTALMPEMPEYGGGQLVMRVAAIGLLAEWVRK